jgi:hypothetical protein
MAHEVFVSYSHHDKPQADAVCATLEAKGIRCWIAPRDVIPGQEWGAAIVNAIHSSRIMVLLFSSHANTSPQISREVQLAVSAEVILIPFRIEDVAPAQSLEYFLGTPHWLDALKPPLEAHLERLAAAVASFLAASEPGGSGASLAPEPQKSSATSEKLTPPGGEGRRWASAAFQRRPVAVVATAAVVASAVVAITGYMLLRPSHTSQTPVAQPAPPSSTLPPPPAPANALDGLLLGVDQINTAMGTTGMSAVGNMSSMIDRSSLVSDQACLPLSAAVQAKDYAGSGWSNVRAQVLAKGQENAVDQAVVSFPSAHDADAFFSASAKSWQACSNRQFTLSANGNSQVNTVGPLSNANGILSATVTPANSLGVCERALTAAKNVVVDVTACVGPPGVAVSIAEHIAAKVSTTQ